jgi:hypothetical protein
MQFPQTHKLQGECPFRLRLNWGAALHPNMKDAECCAGATRWPARRPAQRHSGGERLPAALSTLFV